MSDSEAARRFGGSVSVEVLGLPASGCRSAGLPEAPGRFARFGAEDRLVPQVASARPRRDRFAPIDA